MSDSTENSIKAEMRLWALECLVCQLYAMVYHSTGDPKAALAKRRQTLLSTARQMGFPGLDPAMSDLAAAELEDAVNRLLNMQQELLETG